MTNKNLQLRCIAISFYERRTGFQQFQGPSPPIHFEAYRLSKITPSGILEYEGMSVNTGGAMNRSTGVHL